MKAIPTADDGNPRSPIQRTVNGLAWSMAVASILVAGASLAIGLLQARSSGDFRVIITHQTLTPLITAGFAVMGALVTSRHPRNPIGWIFLVVSGLFALSALVSVWTMNKITRSSTLDQVAFWLDAWLWIPATFLPWTFVLLIFPDGRLPSSRWRVVAWAAAAGLAATLLVVMVHPSPSWTGEANPFGIPSAAPFLDILSTVGLALLALGVIGSLAAFFVRFRRSTGAMREQLKWLAYSIAVILLISGLSLIVGLIWPEYQMSEDTGIVLNNLSILGIASASAIAILRYRLYDIDLIINRTLVYTALTAGVILLYGVVVGALGAVFQSGDNLGLSLLATGLAAILVQPMRDRLQRFVNHLMYGERDDPYAILLRLSRRFEGSLSPEDTLPAVVETIAQALKLPYVAIVLNQEGSFHVAASYGTAGSEWTQLPLVFQGETVGQLRLSPRSANEQFTPSERSLLEDIARHIGGTAHAVLLTQDLRRLAEDLQRSREALVKSREEERRRLRRDLHDELGPQLASLKLNLDVARNLVSRDPQAAETLLLNLRAQSQAAITEIRRLVFDLRPPALDVLGLAGAIQEYTRQIENHNGLTIHIDSPEDLPPLPAAVEVAAYRITLEALANFVRHSQGTSCQVSISSTDRYLRLEVCDDGLGLPKDLQPGVGLNSMRERAAELGGTCVIETRALRGTRVLAEIPLV